jgi:transcriptional regulator with AbiEi antitoxin domain of type IV toxin-antitoxin system
MAMDLALRAGARPARDAERGRRTPTLQEARDLMESAYNLRAKVLQELLQCSTSVKTVRLCLQF